MALEPEQLLERAIEAGALDEQKGRAALAVYARLQDMGAEFTFGDFLVERGLMPRMAVDALDAGTDETFEGVDTLGDFQLVELLGEGENGAVFKALQISLERDVAVKVLNMEIAQDEAAVERFLREARAVAKLNHPNVVHGYAAGSEHGLHYFAMELLQGGSARELMETDGGRLSERRALEIVAQAAEGLKAAHAHGIIHRDVKPDNILLSEEGIAKLTDLGIAQVQYAKADGGMFWGSPPYVAPETVRGSSNNDPRSDIYSLGVTLFELLIGSPPFLADDPEEILRMHLDEEPHDVRQLRPELNAKTGTLVRLMLAKEPGERPLNADVVSKAIARILQEMSMPSRSAIQIPPPARNAAAQQRPQSSAGKRPIPPRSVVRQMQRPGGAPTILHSRAPSQPPPASARPHAVHARPGQNGAQRPNGPQQARPNHPAPRAAAPAGRPAAMPRPRPSGQPNPQTQAPARPGLPARGAPPPRGKRPK